MALSLSLSFVFIASLFSCFDRGKTCSCIIKSFLLFFSAQPVGGGESSLQNSTVVLPQTGHSNGVFSDPLFFIYHI